MLDDRVAIMPVDDPNQYGLIIIPDIAKKRPDQGIIYATGPSVKELQVGDHVLFSSYSGTKLALVDVGTLIIMPESEVVAWLADEERDTLLPLSFVNEVIDRATALHEASTSPQTPASLRVRIRGLLKTSVMTKGFEY